MKRLVALVAVFLALFAVAGVAGTVEAEAKPPINTMVDGDGGGSYIGFFWVYVYTYVNGIYMGQTCQYASTGWYTWPTGVCV